jgi:phosphate transport system substrate-binding protein
MRNASFLCLLGLLIWACALPPRQQIRAVGSSTVYPFVASAAEQFGRTTDFATPIVEATGTGGGFKLFCEGIGPQYPDLANASRPIKDAERELCAQHGVTEIREIPIGFDGIVLAHVKDAPPVNLTKRALFLAMALKVPRNGKLVDNFYERWNQIDPKLPDTEIAVYGPPPTSGTRDAFVELVMHEECEHFPEYTVAYADKEERKTRCGLLREDGHFIDAGENDNIIVRKLESNRTALGIFGYSFLEQNLSIVSGSLIDGVKPTFENIADGHYGISRSLYVYAKEQHIGMIPGIEEFLEELTSPTAIGREGYLSLKGLIPLPERK